MKIEYVFGDRKSGKTFEIFKNINCIDRIGIIVQDSIHVKIFQEKIGYLKNVIFITKKQDLFGKIFDKIYIDDADYFDWKQYLPIIKDTLCCDNGKIYIYFQTPINHNNFSVRVLK